MTEKNVEIVIEAVGNKSLSNNFTVDEIKGKSVEQILFAVINQPWQGEDNMTLQMIKSQVSASNGYTPKVYREELNQPVKFVPVGRDSPILDYVQGTQVMFNVTGDHKVGQNYKR